MAAPWLSMFHGVGLSSGRLLAKGCAPAGCYQQVRYRKAGRYKAPPTAKEKERWIPKSMQVVKEKKIPKNYVEKFLSRMPSDDVWIRQYYPTPRYTLGQALEMHREACSPAMLDDTEALVYLTAQTDMSTSKKTKFLSAFKKTLVYPHQFEDGTENRVIVFCKTSEDKEKALAMGAVHAGGMELIKQIEKGEVTSEEYDHLVCNVDIVQDVVAIRKQLADLFPNKSHGNLTGDIEPLVHHFLHGKTYQATKLTEAVGSVTTPIGKLNMSTEQLQENYDALVESIYTMSQKKKDKSPFITKANVKILTNNETFHLTDRDLLPRSQRHDSEDQGPEDSEDSEEEEEDIRASK